MRAAAAGAPPAGGVGAAAAVGVLLKKPEMDWYTDWPHTLVGLTLGAGCLLYYLFDAAKVLYYYCYYIFSWSGCLFSSFRPLLLRYYYYI